MKLRNLFIASLAVCSMASCSKDDDGISTPQEADAYISIAATTNLMTKTSVDGGTDEGIDVEAKINSLTAYVFTNEDNGKYVTSKHVSLEGSGEGTKGEDYTTDEAGTTITSIRGIHVKVAKPAEDRGPSASMFKVVLLANTTMRTVADLDALKAECIGDILTYNGNKVGTVHLPMHSSELTARGLRISYEKEGTAHHVLNWYAGESVDAKQTETTDGKHDEDPADGSEKVTLSRSVSRVQFTSLTTNFSSLQYKNLSLTVKSIFLANVRENATVMGEENGDAVFYRGALANTDPKFEELQYLIDRNAEGVKTIFCKNFDNGLVINANIGDSEKDNNTDALSFDKYINVNSPESIKGIPFIVNSNGTYSRGEGDGVYQTRLVIEGELKDNGQSLGTKYYHIPLKLVGDAGNVASNKFFKVTAVITGEGSPNPDEILENTCINFSIKVADWNVVKQTEDDTN